MSEQNTSHNAARVESLRLDEIGEATTAFDQLQAMRGVTVELNEGGKVFLTLPSSADGMTVRTVSHVLPRELEIDSRGIREAYWEEKYAIRQGDGDTTISTARYDIAVEERLSDQIMSLYHAIRQREAEIHFGASDPAKEAYETERDDLIKQRQRLQHERHSTIPDALLSTEDQITAALQLTRLLHEARLVHMVAAAELAKANDRI